MTDIRKPVFDVIRQIRGKGFNQDEVTRVDALLDGLGIGRTALPPAPGQTEFPWTLAAKRYIGTQEIPGPRHNPIVLAWWKALGIPVADDETPYCGAFMGAIMKECGIEPPKNPGWARNWANWGKPCDLAYGAIIVLGRPGGGGHVAELMGISADGKHLYLLGANQSNTVSIAPMVKAGRFIAARWPAHLPVGPRAPVMSGGTISTNEA